MMLIHGFAIYGHEDKCIYNQLNNNEGVIIYLYVDDLLIFGTSYNVVHDTKCFLASKFDMKILVEANVILDINIFRDDDCNVLSQSHYVEKKKIKHFDM